MEAFKKNILNIYKDKGKRWLADLPQQVKEIEALWDLNQLKPYVNLSYHYVLSGFQKDVPIILKLSLNSAELEKEAKALDAFRGYGAISVLNRHSHALLLQRAVPGYSLKDFSSKKERIEAACQVVEKLRMAPPSEASNFPQIEEWLATLDKDWDVPRKNLEKARKLKEQLLGKISDTKVLLHGDLHQDNVLLHGEEWLVIDPKGVLGYPINEIWACVEDPQYDLKYIANYFNYPFNTVIQWYYVHTMLAACWQVEDRLDPTLFLALAESVDG